MSKDCKLVHLSLEPELVDLIDSYARDAGLTRTGAISEAVAEMLVGLGRIPAAFPEYVKVPEPVISLKRMRPQVAKGKLIGWAEINNTNSNGK